MLISYKFRVGAPYSIKLTGFNEVLSDVSDVSEVICVTYRQY